jgi:hypothetical protein
MGQEGLMAARRALTSQAQDVAVAAMVTQSYA